MKRILLTATAIGLTAASPALADNQGFYIEGNLGYSTPSDGEVDGNQFELGNGLVSGGAIGYRSDWWRAELNGSYRSLDIEQIKTAPTTKTVNVRGKPVSVAIPSQQLDGDGSASATVGLLNVYLDHDIGLPVRPYVGGGVGLAYVQMESYGQSMSTPAFVWDVAAGLSYDITDHITATAGYRYLHFEGSDFLGVGQSDIGDVGCHEFLAGIRYTF